MNKQIHMIENGAHVGIILMTLRRVANIFVGRRMYYKFVGDFNLFY